MVSSPGSNPIGSTVNNQSSPTPKNNNEDILGQSSSTPAENVESDSASRTIFAWQKLYEINILKGVLEYYKENGAYPFDDRFEMRNFYKSWVEKHGVRVEEDAFRDKMVELPERFFVNRQIIRFNGLVDQVIEDCLDPMEAEIYRLSYKIWGPDYDPKDLSSKGNAGGSSSS